MSMCMWGPMSTAKTVRACTEGKGLKISHSMDSVVHQFQGRAQLIGKGFRLCIFMPCLCHPDVRQMPAGQPISLLDLICNKSFLHSPGKGVHRISEVRNDW